MAEASGDGTDVVARGDQLRCGEVVGSGRGAVLAFQPVRFLGPSSEPDVRVPPASGSPQGRRST